MFVMLSRSENWNAGCSLHFVGENGPDHAWCPVSILSPKKQDYKPCEKNAALDPEARRQFLKKTQVVSC